MIPMDPRHDRIIIDPPMIECPHCGGDEFAITMRARGIYRELHSMRNGTLSENTDLWGGISLSPPSKHVTCGTCNERIGTVVGTGISTKDSEEPVRKVIRISTIAIVKDGRIMLVEKEGLDTLILPGGKQEPGEDDVAALLRELLEELGCRVRGRPKLVGVFRDVAGGAPGVDVEVTVHTGTLVGTPRPMAEIKAIHWIDMEKPEMKVAPSLSNLIMPYLLAMESRKRA